MDYSDLIKVCQLSWQHLYSKKIQPRLGALFSCHCLLILQTVTLPVFLDFHGQLLHIMSISRGLSDISSWFSSDYASLAGIPLTWSLFLSLYPIRKGMIFIYLITGNISFDHLSELVSAKPLFVKSVFFTFVNKYFFREEFETTYISRYSSNFLCVVYLNKYNGIIFHSMGYNLLL